MQCACMQNAFFYLHVHPEHAALRERERRAMESTLPPFHSSPHSNQNCRSLSLSLFLPVQYSRLSLYIAKEKWIGKPGALCPAGGKHVAKSPVGMDVGVSLYP